MYKYAQTTSTFDTGIAGKTFGDLLNAINQDYSLDSMTKDQILNQLRSVTGMASPNTPLSALLYKGLGGMIGWLISKYFGMSPVGQTLSAFAGYGIGRAINNSLNKPKNPYPGWKVL